MNISIPEIPLPFEVPHMVHPLIVHFAIALPVILLILELINLIARRKLLSSINLFFTILILFIFFAAYLSGTADAKMANVKLEALNLHKELGIGLVYGSVALLFFKLLSFINKAQFKLLFLISLIIFIAISFVEGKRGGELVYKYGVNVKNAQETKNKKEEIKPEITNNVTKNQETAKEKEDAKEMQEEEQKATPIKETKEKNNEAKKTEIKSESIEEHNQTKVQDISSIETTNQESDKASTENKEEKEKNKTTQNSETKDENHHITTKETNHEKNKSEENATETNTTH